MALASAFVSAFQRMKELWEMLGIFLSTLKVLGTVLDTFLALDTFLKDYRANYATVRFTSVGWKVLSKIFNTSDIQNLHWDINCWGDEEVKAWKSNCISGYGAVAVAASIFATVGLSGLQLPNLDQTHWSARALMSSSMALGVFSLSCATSLYRQVSRLQTPLQIRLWLSRGTSRRNYPPPFIMFPLESSISALQISEVPGTLLNLSVMIYLIGFGLYLLYSWLNDVPDGATDNRNVFIFFVVTVGLFTAYYECFSIARNLDASRTRHDFDLIPSKDFVKPKRRKNLELMLSALQAIQQLSDNPEDEAEYQNLKRAARNLLQEIGRDWMRLEESTHQWRLGLPSLEVQTTPVELERISTLFRTLQDMLPPEREEKSRTEAKDTSASMAEEDMKPAAKDDSTEVHTKPVVEANTNPVAGVNTKSVVQQNSKQATEEVPPSATEGKPQTTAEKGGETGVEAKHW